jgi:hypothetical protein
MNRTRDISLPDEIAELFRRVQAQGITLTPVKGDFGFGCWGFQGHKGTESVEVFWDGRDRLLHVSRLLHGKWESDSVHPVALSYAVGLAGDILLSKLSDEKTST